MDPATHLWLNGLYDSFECEAFRRDFDQMKVNIEKFREWSDSNLRYSAGMSDDQKRRIIEEYLGLANGFERFYMLADYADLTLSVESENETAAKYSDMLDTALSDLKGPEASFNKFIAEAGDLDALAQSSKLISDHLFILKEKQDESKHMLTESEEILLSKMRTTGSSAWGKLKEQLTSVLMVPLTIDGKTEEHPLTVIRNMAHEKDAALRKAAYEAELAAYPEVEKSVAAALNSIKGEVITISKLRGYTSPLDMTLNSTRMERRTLDVMFEAIKANLPTFMKYFRKKAEILGHKNGLPFYDLFAPVGESEMRFTYEEAAEYVISIFGRFSEKLADFARLVYKNNWIDALPRKGKIGGAFCAHANGIRETRIMLNFGNAYDDVLTFAHELGHGYHSFCLKEEHHLNTSYPMPIAETASTFCEMMLADEALKTAKPEDALLMLDSDLGGLAQIIVDIYSRFLFEDGVFKARENGSLSVDELKDLMLNAQKQAYGEGLDHNYLHPYMWVCKPHYYFPSHNYYNFPYAYGMLFAKGLYALNAADHASFVGKYDNFLASTGKNNLVDLGKLLDIDVNDIKFWQSSFDIIAASVDQFCALADKR